MNGGEGLRCFSPRLIVLILKGPSLARATTALTSASERRSAFLPSSAKKRAEKVVSGRAQLSQASSSQYSSFTKPLISRSRSTTMRVATDWTRPADRPRRIFFHSSGESL